MTNIDILGLGATAVDRLRYVPAYPPAKQQGQRPAHSCGGLMAMASAPTLMDF
jgi:hypothetical protein